MKDNSRQKFAVAINIIFYLFVIYIISINIFITKGPHIIYRIIILALLFLMLRTIKIKILRALFSTIISALIAADISGSTLTWLSFGSQFNDGFAVSVLGSNATEITSMTGLYIGYLLFFLVAFTVLFLKGMLSSPIKNGKYVNATLAIITVIFTVTSVNYVKYSSPLQKKDEKTYLLVASRLSTYFPIFNASYFLTALQQSCILDEIAKKVPDYHLTVHDTQIDNYVLVVGESERTENMGIYGYAKDTTPVLTTQKKNILLFRHAISGAPITNLAVPLALTAATVGDHNLEKYSDNVINLANAAGYYTSWISAQSAFGSNGTAVTSIAYNAKDKLYLTGYDEELLTHFKEVLNRPEKKKLIVLHIYGSHEPECIRYPDSEAIFNHQNDGVDACYDNSVHYTDKILGKIFSLLEGKKSSVFYFSDHALERNPKSSSLYFHGGGESPSKEAYKVPMFIWYSPLVSAAPKGTEINEIFSTSYNDLLIKSWLGADAKNSLQDIIQRHNGIDNVLNASSSVLHFSALREHFSD